MDAPLALVLVVGPLALDLALATDEAGSLLRAMGFFHGVSDRMR